MQTTFIVDEYVEYMAHVAAAAPNTPFYLYDNDRVTGLTCKPLHPTIYC